MQELKNHAISAELDEPSPSIFDEALGDSDEARFRRLAAAVILQAVADLSRQGAPLQRHSARAWFAGQREEGLSFELCCKLLDRDTDDTRRKLEAHYGQAFSAFTLPVKPERPRNSSPWAR